MLFQSHLLATAVSLAPQFLLQANMQQEPVCLWLLPRKSSADVSYHHHQSYYYGYCWLPLVVIVIQVKVKVTLRLTVSQSVSLGVPDIYYSLTVTVLFLWGALSDERTGLSFVYAAGPCHVVFLGSESLGTRDHILLSQIWHFPFHRLLRLLLLLLLFLPLMLLLTCILSAMRKNIFLCIAIGMSINLALHIKVITIWVFLLH
jgi:hypothetical protein